MNYQRFEIIGRLTRDPQTKQLPSGDAVTEFGMACSKKYRTKAGEDREETLFIDCTAFGKVASTLAQYCTKGKPLFCEGTLRLDQWEDRNGGGKRSKISMVVNNFQFLGSRDGQGAGGGDDQGGGERQQAPQRSAPSRPPARAPNGGAFDDLPEGGEVDEASIPF